MTGFEVLSDAEVAGLAEAGGLPITTAGRALLNRVLALWLTAEDETKRRKRLQKLVSNLRSHAVGLGAILEEGGPDALQLWGIIRRFADADHVDVVEVFLEYLPVLASALAKAEGEKAGPGQPKHDWLKPYLSAVLATYSKIGGDNKLPSNGDYHWEADEPAYRFVRDFIEIVLGRIALSSSNVAESTREFAGKAGKSGGNLTQFLRQCVSEFEAFPSKYRQHSLLLLPEGLKSEFNSIFAAVL